MTKKAAQQIIDTQDYQPWHKVEDAKRALGIDVKAENRAEAEKLAAKRREMGLD